MKTSPTNSADQAFLRRTIEATIRIGVVFLLVVWCYDIIRPFLEPTVWGAIIAAALYPLYRRLLSHMAGRRGLAATVFIVLVLTLLITPIVMLSMSLVETTQDLSQSLREGTLKVPPPAASIAAWPVVGEATYDLWALASENLQAAVKQLEPQLKVVGGVLWSSIAGAGIGMLKFVISIIIAGALMARAETVLRGVSALTNRLAGDRGPELQNLAGATVRSVVQGVVGVAFIQAILAGIGFLVMGVPGAGIWTLLLLLLAIVQLPVLLILGPIIVYVFSVADTLPAVLFAIWSIFVGMSDGLLKPLLLGRGVDVPMLVILLGAIGGLMTSGIIGLFVGSVTLAVGYKLFIAWLYVGVEAAGSEPVLPNKAG